MQANEINPERLLTRDEVEALFGISRRYLEVSAVRGDGPPMIGVGRSIDADHHGGELPWVSRGGHGP